MVPSLLGGANLLAAKRAFFPWDKLDKLKQGQSLLNKAVEQADDPYEARLLRGIAGSHLPKQLGQREKATADLKWAAKRAEDKLEAGAIEPRQAAAAYFHYGRMLRAQGSAEQATEHWRRAVALSPDSYTGLQAKRALSRAAK